MGGAYLRFQLFIIDIKKALNQLSNAISFGHIRGHPFAELKRSLFHNRNLVTFIALFVDDVPNRELTHVKEIGKVQEHPSRPQFEVWDLLKEAYKLILILELNLPQDFVIIELI